MNESPGIYEIMNLLTGDSYVGQSLHPRKRWVEHKGSLRHGHGINPHLQYAWDKYGEEAFSFRVLVVCEPFELLRYEQAIVDSLMPAYNVCTQCVKSMAGVRLTAKHRANIAAGIRRAFLDPELRAERSAWHRGRPLSPEHRAAIAAAHHRPDVHARVVAALIGRHPSAETRAKMSVAQRRRHASPETRAAISAGQRASWERRRCLLQLN